MALYASTKLHPIKWEKITSISRMKKALYSEKYKTFSISNTIEEKGDIKKFFSILSYCTQQIKKVPSVLYVHEPSLRRITKIVRRINSYYLESKGINKKFKLNAVISKIEK
jgi:hypothetical protein